VNAVAHSDYTSNGSVQVMLFNDRLEIWNPGSLPPGWTVEKLKKRHPSIPANPLLARPMSVPDKLPDKLPGTLPWKLMSLSV